MAVTWQGPIIREAPLLVANSSVGAAVGQRRRWQRLKHLPNGPKLKCVVPIVLDDPKGRRRGVGGEPRVVGDDEHIEALARPTQSS